MVVVFKKIFPTPSAQYPGVVREIKTKMGIREEEDFHSIPAQFKPEP
jgi:hypothetical protein